MPIIVNNLSFAYDRQPVLQDVNLALNPQKLTFLLGSNGAGKTTLFRCLLGQLQGWRGEIAIDGKPLQSYSVSALAQKIAYIPQKTSPGFNFSVLQMVLMGRTVHLSAFASPGLTDRQISREALDRLGILSLEDKGFAEISGGEQQLVLIARALVQQAPILIMDEPTASLDYGNQLRVLEQIQMLCHEGLTVLLSSHNPQHAFLFADSVLTMEKGRITATGAPIDVLTESRLQQLYDFPIRLTEVTCGQQRTMMMMPLAGTAKFMN